MAVSLGDLEAADKSHLEDQISAGEAALTGTLQAGEPPGSPHRPT